MLRKQIGKNLNGWIKSIGSIVMVKIIDTWLVDHKPHKETYEADTYKECCKQEESYYLEHPSAELVERRIKDE
jgi:hypothetical protein